MVSSTVVLFVAQQFLILLLELTSLIEATPLSNLTCPNMTSPSTAAGSAYWLANIQRQGAVASRNSSYQIFQNVMTFGAVGKLQSTTFIEA